MLHDGAGCGCWLAGGVVLAADLQFLPSCYNNKLRKKERKKESKQAIHREENGNELNK